MRTRIAPQFHAQYLAWLDQFGVSYEEFGELVDRERERLPAHERAILERFDLQQPETLTAEQHAILGPLLARAIAQARVLGLSKRNGGKRKRTS